MTRKGRGEVPAETEREKCVWETEEKSPHTSLLPGFEGRRVWGVQHYDSPRSPSEASGKLRPQPTGGSRRA